MDREQLISRLPEALATALRLHDAGQSVDIIATALGIPVEGVPVLIDVALGKLKRLADGEDLRDVIRDCPSNAVPDR